MPPADDPQPFGGFGDEALVFYEGLEADNSRTYWTDHAEMYGRAVRGPMLALLGAVEPVVGPMKFFRPHRDLRFSKDKSPYKTHAAAVSRSPDGPSLYVQVSAAGLLVASGTYAFSADQLVRYRSAVDADTSGAALAGHLDRLLAEGFGCYGEQLTRVPRGFDAGHPRADLLRRKGLAPYRDAGTPDWLATPRCLDEILATWRRTAPVSDWLARHVGRADAPPG